MIAFKPKAEPILTQIAKSGLFQFMMVIALGVGVTWFVIRTDRPQQWIQKINRFASVAPNPSSTVTTQNTEAGIAEDSADLEAPPAAASAWAARSMGASAPEMTSGAALGTASDAVSTKTSNLASAAQMVNIGIVLTEIDNDYLNTIMQKAFAANSIIQDNDIKIFIDPSSPPQAQSEKTRLELNQVVRKNYGTANRGFTINMTLIKVNENAYSIRLLLNKIHPNDNFQIPLDFTLRDGERLYITGHSLLSYFEFENDLINTPPFTILKSADYRNQKTTFAIIIELQ